MIKKVLKTYRASGIIGMFRAVRQQYFPAKAKCFLFLENALVAARGLEIGGPSDVFKSSGVVPLYPVLKALDNCNFAEETTWEGVIDEGLTFRFNAKADLGQQYISEASNLSAIASGSYDFVLSSHVIEHVANPLQALSEWVRVLRDDGILVLLVPHKEGTFDHKRPVTSLAHLIDDYSQKIREDDLTHLEEILKLHDLERDPAAGDYNEFKCRSEHNLENRCLHHHVFDTSLVAQILSHLNLKILSMEAVLPFHIIAVAQKLTSDQSINNQGLLDGSAQHFHDSPFRADKTSS